MKPGPQPEAFAKAGTEHAAQVALFMWAAQQQHIPELKDLFAIPNGGERNIIVAASLKAEGVKEGVPDICLPVPRGPWHGLYIELKRPKSDGKAVGRPTGAQLDWIKRLRERGYGAVVCVGWEAARDVLLSYLNWR